MVTQQTLKYILFEKRGRVGLITLNRPDRLNAWSYPMGDEINHAIEDCNNDPGVGAIVVTGAGRGFCAGADVSGFNRAIEEREAGQQESERSRRRDGHLAGFLRDAKPIIAAVNGPSIGVGLTMTLPMDIRIASEEARFSMRFIRMGITPEVASTTYLAQIVGLANALDLILTARIINADEAGRMGLVNRVVPADRLMDEAMALADEIANNPTPQVWAAKRMVHRHMVEQDIDAVVTEENRRFAEAYQTADHKEAVRAFLERRQPQFNQPA